MWPFIDFMLDLTSFLKEEKIEVPHLKPHRSRRWGTHPHIIFKHVTEVRSSPHFLRVLRWGSSIFDTWILESWGKRESHLSFFWQFEKNTSYEITIKLPRLKVFYPYPHDFKCILRILNIMYNLHGISWIYANVLELDKIKPSLFHNFINKLMRLLSFKISTCDLNKIIT